MDQDLFQKIENFRFSKRYQTRSEATIKLIRLGIQSLELKEQQASPEKSDSRQGK